MLKFNCFSAIDTSRRVDAENGVIYGVSVITEGEAQGHKLWIDKTTLSQVRDVASTFSDGVKVKVKHDSKGEFSSPVHDIIGSLKNFKVKGDRVTADLHLLKSDKHFDKIIEMAKEIPAEFGLSVAFSGESEKVESKSFARCEELYSVDLTDDPAANPTGLFSKKMEEMAKECKCGKPECKMCMEAKKKESEKTKMSTIMNIDTKTLLSALKLPDTASEADIQAAFVNRLTAQPGDTTELSKKLDGALTELATFRAQGANAVALAKKGEIDNLMAEASRAGKVVPFDNDDLYTVDATTKAITIKQEPVALSKIISKLQPSQVKLSRAAALVTPKNDKGEPITDPEQRKEYCLSKQAEGAAALSQRFSEMKSNRN